MFASGQATPRFAEKEDPELEALYAQVEKLLEKGNDQCVSWRHDIHKHPELPNREFRTAGIVADHLRAIGCDAVRTGVAGTGVVGVLKGRAPTRSGNSKIICLRADMDALPVKETFDIPYASKVVDETYPGGPFPVMHACGHDTHVAMLMSAASVLAAMRDSLHGTVVFLFQPAEEGPPLEEAGGARQMMAEGWHEVDGVSYEPGMVFGIHVGPTPTGSIGWREGTMFAASALLKIDIQGKQVHGSMPWLGKDPLVVAADVITQCGQLYRQMPATSAFTISIGHVVDQGRFNIIGDSVTLYGTVRALVNDDMDAIKKKVERLVDGIAKAHDMTGVATFHQSVPAILHTRGWTQAVLPTLIRAGKGKVEHVEAVMGYDDVSEFINRYGGFYATLGCQDTEYLQMDDGRKQLQPIPGGRGIGVNHHPAFYANDECLPVGVRIHCHVVLDYLYGGIDPHRMAKEAIDAA
ncbi:N-acyl-L-amino acid amidohydrolase [Gonapodya prolifera JEL478]|uniref:N-acyl-L-amino acid amidohydrolase n=1 Tax=Gonapodya prolifera (strain JEL478) TaxID=1344416 RepID=A0A139AJ54_GONPJ|nr:N-acyl-L-amino acid amidohydrolase [Gonapodya prolifera JEL478]|eukprot:KXS16827.1 N-acyl-L-amino acid amidohydrolase [Gonapodya prolifera JEL478]